MHLQRKIVVFPERTDFANALMSARLEQRKYFAPSKTSPLNRAGKGVLSPWFRITQHFQIHDQFQCDQPIFHHTESLARIRCLFYF